MKKVFRGGSGSHGIETCRDQMSRRSHSIVQRHLPGPSAITGSGTARVIGLVPHQIITEPLEYAVDAQALPDLGRDILKVVVVNRYRPGPCGVGLVHGFGFSGGAIASSVSHDTHNIVAVGTSDPEILWAIDEVIKARGAMVAVRGNTRTILPLDCAGLMSTLPYPQVAARLADLHRTTGTDGGDFRPLHVPLVPRPHGHPLAAHHGPRAVRRCCIPGRAAVHQLMRDVTQTTG